MVAFFCYHGTQPTSLRVISAFPIWDNLQTSSGTVRYLDLESSTVTCGSHKKRIVLVIRGRGEEWHSGIDLRMEWMRRTDIA